MSDNDTRDDFRSFSIFEGSGSSNSTKSVYDGRKHASLASRAVDGTFFKYLPEKCNVEQNRAVAVCVLCQPNVVEIKGYKNSSSNFISHLKRRHGNNAYMAFKKHMGRETIFHRSPAIKKVGSLQRTVPQQKFEEDITKYIINSMIPLKTVDDPYFKAIFDNLNISERGLTLLNSRSLGYHIDSLFAKQMLEVRENLKNVPHVCTTADIWLARRKNYLAVTAHWITSDLERKSVFLACRRFSNGQTIEKITELLHEIHSDFGLMSNKIVATIKTFGNDIVDSFDMYGTKENVQKVSEEKSLIDNGKNLNTIEINSVKQEWIDFSERCDLDDNEESDLDSDNSNVETKLSQYRNNALSNIEQILPYLNCHAHTLSLCVATDASRVLREPSELSVLHSQVMKKCNALWKVARQPNSTEIIENLLGYTLIIPGETKWNSIYYSLKQLIGIKEKCLRLFEVLNITNVINEREFEYIEEHLTCIAPMAEALDLLQSETNSYYGIVLPCLLALQRKLRILAKRELTYCRPLIEALLGGVETRFNEFFEFCTAESKNAVIAALTYPRFKNTWFLCVEPSYHEHLLTLFKQATMAEMTPEIPQSNDADVMSREDTFFDFGAPNTKHSSQLLSKVDLQVLQYLGDEDQRLDVLVRYPEIRKVFIKYNTPLPSSASVKRLLSYETMKNIPKLSDSTFERRIVLKANLKSI